MGGTSSQPETNMTKDTLDLNEKNQHAYHAGASDAAGDVQSQKENIKLAAINEFQQKLVSMQTKEAVDAEKIAKEIQVRRYY